MEGEVFVLLIQERPKIMSDVLYRTTKYMNIEDALLARKEKPKKRERQEDARQDRGRKMARTEDQQEDRHSKPPLEGSPASPH